MGMTIQISCAVVTGGIWSNVGRWTGTPLQRDALHVTLLGLVLMSLILSIYTVFVSTVPTVCSK